MQVVVDVTSTSVSSLASFEGFMITRACKTLPLQLSDQAEHTQTPDTTTTTTTTTNSNTTATTTTKGVALAVLRDPQNSDKIRSLCRELTVFGSKVGEGC